ARVEPKRYEALLATAEANVRKAEANVEKAKANATRTDAGYRDAQEMLALKVVLMENLRRAGTSASREAKQEGAANVELARARLAVAKADQAVAAADLAAAQKEVDAAKSMRDLAEHNLKRSQVRAPYTGQINQRKITRGTYLEEKTVIATMAD